MPRVTVASLLICLLAAACTPRRAPEDAPEPPPTVVLHGARLDSYQGDRRVLSGRAARATYQRSTGEVRATEATLRMPSAEQSQATPPGLQGGLEVSAPNMDGSFASKQLVATGGVVVRSGEGMVARTPRLMYDTTTRQARGDEGVTVQGPDYHLRADRFQLSFPEETFTFEGSVQTVLGASE